MLVDVVGSAVMFTVGAPLTGVSVEINVSYLDAAFLDVSLSPSLSLFPSPAAYSQMRLLEHPVTATDH